MKNIPTAWCCHHHASLWGWCSQGDGRSWVCARRSVFLDGPKATFDQSTLFHMFGDSPTCLLANTKHVYLFFSLSNCFFSGQLFLKAQLCGVYSLKWSYGQILQSLLWSFAAPSGLSWVSLLPLWLMPSLSGSWVLVGGPLLAGLLWCHILKNV